VAPTEHAPKRESPPLVGDSPVFREAPTELDAYGFRLRGSGVNPDTDRMTVEALSFLCRKQFHAGRNPDADPPNWRC